MSLALKTVADYVNSLETGNHFRTWASLGELERSGYKGLVWVRPKHQGERRWYLPAVHTSMVSCLSQDILLEAFFTEIPPEGTQRVIQGQVTYPSKGPFLHLGYDRSQRPLREVLESDGYTWLNGYDAYWMLKVTLDVEDFEMLEEVLEKFPGCVVEFTMWEKAVGVMNRRLCFWEVRNY